MAKIIDDPSGGPESLDELQRQHYIFSGDGCNAATNPSELSETTGIMPFGAYAVAKEMPDWGPKNEGRVVVSELYNDRGDPVGAEFTAVDATGNGEEIAEVLATEFAKGGDVSKIVDNALLTLKDENDVPNGSMASFGFVRVLNDNAEVAVCGICRVTIWDKDGNIIFQSKDESKAQDLVDAGTITQDEVENRSDRSQAGNGIAKGGINTLVQIYKDIKLPEGAFIKVSTSGDIKNRNDNEAFAEMMGKDVINGVKSHFRNVTGSKIDPNYNALATVAYVHSKAADSKKIIGEGAMLAAEASPPIPRITPAGSTSSVLPPPPRPPSSTLPPPPSPRRAPVLPPPPRATPPIPPAPRIAPTPVEATPIPAAPDPTPAPAAPTTVPEAPIEDNPFADNEDELNRSERKTTRNALLIAAGLTAAAAAGVYAIGEDKPEKIATPTIEIADTLPEIDQMQVDIINSTKGPIAPEKLKAMLKAADESVKLARKSGNPELIESADALDAIRAGAERELNK